MTRLCIVTANVGPTAITKQFFQETVANTRSGVDVIVVANGCTETELDELGELCVSYSVTNGRGGSAWICSKVFPNPVGSTRAFNEGAKYVHPDNILAMLHNDLMVREVGWDQKVLSLFDMIDEDLLGVVGFHGSKQLGHDLIYQAPYQMGHLGRGLNYSNMEDAESHGERTTLLTEVVTVDGMALICRSSDFSAWGGLEELFRHHMYDHDLCLTARLHGRKNAMLPVNVRHISGQTANMPRYNEQMKKLGYLGGDVDVHAEAHRLFWQKWEGTGALPARCP